MTSSVKPLKTIQDMEVGERGYVAPWAVDREASGRLLVSGSDHCRRNMMTITTMLVERTATGVKIISGCEIRGEHNSEATFWGLK